MEFISMRLYSFRQRFIIKVEKKGEKAKPLYEKIIFNPRTQYLLLEARKLQAMRGDINL
jgi:hypothetical protein